MGSLVPSTPAVVALEEARLGYAALSLSNWATSGLPQVIGNVEVAGALYTFPSLESIAGWSGLAAGPAWVKVIPALDGTASAAWTSVAPAWSDDKQGWYSPTAGEESHRYAFSAVKVDASNCTKKAEVVAPRVGAAHGMEVFTSSGYFMVPGNVSKVFLTGTAAGGSGGAGGAGAAAGGGGGSGSACLRKAVTVTPGASVAVTVGGAGAITSFGSLVLNPGSNGQAGVGNNPPGAGGAPGAIGGGDVAGAWGGAGGAGAGAAGADGIAAGGGRSGTVSAGYGSGGGGGGGLGNVMVFGALATGGAVGTGGLTAGAPGALSGGGGGGSGSGAAGGAGGYGSGGGGGGAASGAGGAGGPAIIVVEW